MNVLNKNGTSLMEALVTVLIFVMIIGGVYASASVGESSWQTNSTKMELQQDLRKAMSWMKYELRQAGPSSIVDVPSDGVSQSDITFKIPSTVSGGSIVWETDTIRFLLGGAQNNQLQKIKGGTTSILANDISTLSFTRYPAAPNVLEVSMLAQKETIKGIMISSNLNFKLQLRNN